jgi:hypothetical protein
MDREMHKSVADKLKQNIDNNPEEQQLEQLAERVAFLFYKQIKAEKNKGRNEDKDNKIKK